MSKITTDEVHRIARLAQIAITDDEAKELAKQLGDILTYVEQLDAVDTTGLQPTYQVTGLTGVKRKDQPIKYGVSREGLLQNAAKTNDGYIEVPKVL